MKGRLLAIFVMLSALAAANLHAEEGDFFFAPEVGWSHFFSDNLEEGIYTGAHFAYDTSDHISIDLIAFYGDNNGESGSPDLRYVLGGGGISYKFLFGNVKPSFFAGATVAGIDFSNDDQKFRGGFYLGTAIEFYINKIISLGISFKYLPLLKIADASLLGFRFGFEL